MAATSWISKIRDGEWSFFGLLDRLINLAFPPTLKLSPLEKRLIDEVLNKLPPVARAAVERQMAAHNLVQRVLWWRESWFYIIRRGRSVYPYPDELKFPERNQEFKFANIKFKVPGDDTIFHSNFWVYEGHFYRITFSPEMKKIMNRGDVEILKLKVHPKGLMQPLGLPADTGEAGF